MPEKKPAKPTPAMTSDQVRHFIAALAKARPDAKTELTYTTPFTLLVAVVLSAQATDISVNKATAGLFAKAPTPQAMVSLGEAGIAKEIKTIGLWQAKARHVAALSKALIENFGGEVPDSREKLETLPGVGRKTANVVLNEIFGEPTMAVDTHIFRIGNRTGLAPGKTPRAVEDQLLKRLPPDSLRHAHHWLILHGRYTCTARAPKCGTCPARNWCRYPDKPPATTCPQPHE
jgi:endonuclease-3